MIYCGTDIVEIARIAKAMEQPRFLREFFTEEEVLLFEKKNYAAQSVAANFCAKEALSKALGTGVSGFAFKDIGVLRDEQGKPYFQLAGVLAHLHTHFFMDVSLSHNEGSALAFVVLLQKDHRGDI